MKHHSKGQITVVTPEQQKNETDPQAPENPQNLCWIHVRNLEVFAPVGVQTCERETGTRLRIQTSVQVPYRKTLDRLTNTLDYGTLATELAQAVHRLGHVHLLEFLLEHLLDHIGENFSQVRQARVEITKIHVPLHHFSGEVAVEAIRRYY